jgi:hypothetical protein
VLDQCLAIYEKEWPDSWRTFEVKSLLGGALLGQRKYADAEPLLREGYQGMKERAAKIVPTDQGSLTDALERLVRLHDAWGKPDEATKWRQELEAHKKAAEKPATPKKK